MPSRGSEVEASSERPKTVTLVVATSNRGKLSEFRELLVALPVEVIGLAEALAKPPSIIEDGATFRENAMKKALVVGRATGMLTLADDSGLEVDALGGRPGVRSARFAGERATDAENNASLLDALAEVPAPRRTARFRCALVLMDPFAARSETPIVTEATCEGIICRESRGTAGFGYDPLFLVAGAERTMAELSDQEKNQVSHRAAAVRQMVPAIEAILRHYGETAARLMTPRE